MAITSLRQLWSSFIPGSRLVDGGDCLNLANVNNSASNGLIALAGGGAAGATLLPSAINEVATVVTAADSCLLPPAIAGLQVVLINDGANSTTVWPNQSNPATGVADTIADHNSSVQGASVAVAAAAVGVFYCFKNGEWKLALNT